MRTRVVVLVPGLVVALTGAAVVLLTASDLPAAERTSPPAERPPETIVGYTKDGSDSISGFCHPPQNGTVACDFTEVHFDPPHTTNASAGEQKRRTCQLSVLSYTKKFRRIGVRKWLSEQVPEEPCEVVESWELSSDDESLVWSVRSTRVSVGTTAGLCAAVAKTRGEVTEWKMHNPQDYKLPCDFMAYPWSWGSW